VMPPRPWPLPTDLRSSPLWTTPNPAMPATASQIMGMPASASVASIGPAIAGIGGMAGQGVAPHETGDVSADCKTCGHLWRLHENGRCGHLFGMEGAFAHVCGCGPDEREVLYPLLPGELGPAPTEPIGMAAAVAAVAAVALAIRR